MCRHNKIYFVPSLKKKKKEELIQIVSVQVIRVKYKNKKPLTKLKSWSKTHFEPDFYFTTRCHIQVL